MARQGLGLVLVSSELEEVAAVSDRVIVLTEGRMAGTLDRGSGDITAADIVHLAFRVPGDDGTAAPGSSAKPETGSEPVPAGRTTPPESRNEIE